MKKIFYTLILATFIFSCDDQLELFPVDELVEATAFQTVSDLENGMRGFLGNLNPTISLAFSSIFTDNCKLGVDNGGQQLNNLNQILNEQTGGPGLWGNRYGVINSINRVIEAAQAITPSSSEADAYNNVLAQCYAFRAYAHHELFIYYGVDPLDGSAAAVPYQSTVSTTDLPARATTDQVVAALIADLDTAEGFLPSSQTDINFASEDFITFLRARIALYSGDYASAITYATTLIGNYSLADTNQYFDMFNEDADVTEVIWKYDNVQGFNYNAAGTWIFTGTGGNFIEMSNGLFNLLDANDVRSTVLVDPVTTMPALNIHGIGKYPPNADQNYINDYKGMRISEMYLIRAEAYARSASPQLGLAAADVDAVRTARFSVAPAASSYGNLVDAITGIKLERRIELAYEGHRYLDIKRYRNILNVGIERDPMDCVGGLPCSLPINSERFIVPIPQAEINANINITQAPGY